MRTQSAVQTVTVALLAARLWVGVAQAADDQIKVGKWEFSVLVPGVTQLPPGMENQAGVKLGPDVSGDTVRWSWSCATDKATFQSEGVVHYHGETLDGELTTRTSTAGHPPIEKSQSLTGRYLGPCGDK